MAAARILSKKFMPLLCRSSASLFAAGHASAEAGIRALHGPSNPVLPSNHSLHAFAARYFKTIAFPPGSSKLTSARAGINPMEPPFVASINRAFSSSSSFRSKRPMGAAYIYEEGRKARRLLILAVSSYGFMTSTKPSHTKSGTPPLSK